MFGLIHPKLGRISCKFGLTQLGLVEPNKNYCSHHPFCECPPEPTEDHSLIGVLRPLTEVGALPFEALSCLPLCLFHPICSIERPEQTLHNTTYVYCADGSKLSEYLMGRLDFGHLETSLVSGEGAGVNSSVTTQWTPTLGARNLELWREECPKTPPSDSAGREGPKPSSGSESDVHPLRWKWGGRGTDTGNVLDHHCPEQ